MEEMTVNCNVAHLIQQVPPSCLSIKGDHRSISTREQRISNCYVASLYDKLLVKDKVYYITSFSFDCGRLRWLARILDSRRRCGHRRWECRRCTWAPAFSTLSSWIPQPIIATKNLCTYEYLNKIILFICIYIIINGPHQILLFQYSRKNSDILCPRVLSLHIQDGFLKNCEALDLHVKIKSSSVLTILRFYRQ